MLKLIRLEFKKFRIEKYCINSLITAVCVALLLGMTIYFAQQDGDPMCENEDAFFMIVDTFAKSTYLIFASVVLAKLTVDEYKNKTINLMFMYPVSRKKIFVAKIAIVVVFTIISMLMADTIMCISGMCLVNALKAVPGGITMTGLGHNIIIFVIGAVLVSIIALVSFFVGIRKKSTAATIVTGVVLTTIISSSSGDTTEMQLLQRLLIVGIGALLVDIVGFIYTFKRIETEDL